MTVILHCSISRNILIYRSVAVKHLAAATRAAQVLCISSYRLGASVQTLFGW
jgi:hypothetical protein